LTGNSRKPDRATPAGQVIVVGLRLRRVAQDSTEFPVNHLPYQRERRDRREV
jgi:hypothetical protein